MPFFYKDPHTGDNMFRKSPLNSCCSCDFLLDQRGLNFQKQGEQYIKSY